MAPSIFLIDITTGRSSDGTSIVIVWRKVSLEEAHGFFEYIIVLDAVNSRRRQSSDITVHVPFNKTTVNVTVLNPQLTYTVIMRIAVQNESGLVIEGPTSIPIPTKSLVERLLQSNDEDDIIVLCLTPELRTSTTMI